MKLFNGKSGVYLVARTNDIIILNKIKNNYYNITTNAKKTFKNLSIHKSLQKDLVYIGKF
jgi:hypothetical protein